MTIKFTMSLKNNASCQPNDDHVTGCGSQSVDEGAEDGHGHVRGETSATVLGVGTLAQPHRCAAARRVGGGHTAAVVKDLGRESVIQWASLTEIYFSFSVVDLLHEGPHRSTTYAKHC